MSDLIELKTIESPEKVFVTGGLDPLITEIEKMARSIHTDVSTKQGREDIRSLAVKVRSSKTTIDKVGKELGEDYRAKLNEINSERKRGVERLQALQDEVRKPLTDFENKEKSRIKSHEDALSLMMDCATFKGFETITSETVKNSISELNELHSREWEEFKDRAKQTYDTALKHMRQELETKLENEKREAELESLRKEKEERERKAREEMIAQQAAEKAREDERARIEAENKKRVEEEARAKAEEEKRQADKEHRAKINNEAVNALNILGFKLEDSREIINAIAKGEIPNVSIKY